ncbi:MAG: SAM-dependent methyltransferase [Methylocella sp.]
MLGTLKKRLSLKERLGFTGPPTEAFEKLYAANSDPWNYRSSDYERQKYASTLESLSRHHYSSALEIGCSIGVMTKMLAERCDKLLSVDVVEHALRQARQRCAAETHVEFARMRVPEDWPQGSFDLIVISEVLYYLSAADVDALIARLRNTSARGGEMILVSGWTTRAHRLLPWLCRTNRWHDRIIAKARDFARVTLEKSNESYRLDRLHRV